MEQKNTKSAVVQSKKELLATYVHDAVEMEVHRHTIKCMIEEAKLQLNDKLWEIHNNYQKIINTYQEQINELHNERNKLENQLNNSRTEINISNCNNSIEKLEKDIINSKPQSMWKYIIKTIKNFWYIPIIPVAAIICLVTVIVMSNPYITMEYTKEKEICLIIFWGIILLHIIFAFIGKASDKSKYEKIKQKNSQTICKLRKQIEEYQNSEVEIKKSHRIRIPQIHIEIQKYNEQVSELNSEEDKEKESITLIINNHINTLGQKLETLESQLTGFYTMNLIPPDYRSLECVIAFDQMFRNDLVDNMREAALLYDERVFRGEMIQGLDNIYRAMDTLGGLMSETISVLRNIESNTDRMCDELMDISSNLVRMNANVTGHLSTISSNLKNGLGAIADSQYDIASELEYSRYANDAIRANSDRMIWYAEQRRQGLL